MATQPELLVSLCDGTFASFPPRPSTYKLNTYSVSRSVIKVRILYTFLITGSNLFLFIAIKLTGGFFFMSVAKNFSHGTGQILGKTTRETPRGTTQCAYAQRFSAIDLEQSLCAFCPLSVAGEKKSMLIDRHCLSPSDKSIYPFD